MLEEIAENTGENGRRGLMPMQRLRKTWNPTEGCCLADALLKVIINPW
jgi:hypothetical protein